jgi:hypothetical protein
MLLFIGSKVIPQAAPRDPRLDNGCEKPLEDARKAMEASLALSHLTVHSIDPSGLTAVGPHSQASTPNKQPRPGRLVRLEQTQEETADRLTAQGSLDYLPGLTGGRRVIDTNAPEAKVPAIFGESSTYYLLAFESELPPGSPKTSSIEVKVSRPNVNVFAQRKYQHRPGAAPARANAAEVQPLLGAIRGLFPVATRPLTLAVAALPAPGANATVVVNMDAGAFAPAGVDAGASARGSSPIPLNFALSAMDPTGREIGSSTKSLAVTFNTAMGSGPAETNVQTSVELPPGDYEIRMAVADPATGTVASVFAPLRVPRFADEPLSLSDVIVLLRPQVLRALRYGGHALQRLAPGC